jgi:REP element-mobilizing transposase RayT
MAEIARRIRMFPLAIGGVADHVHLLVSLPTTLTIAQGIKRIKGGSARWVHEIYPLRKDFAWQTGYGSFSVDASRIATVIAYINNQERHHRKRDYQNEVRMILKRHNVEYDERSIWN